MPVPLDDCFDRVESSRCDDAPIDSEPHSSEPPRATGNPQKDVQASKPFVTAKVDTQGGPRLITATRERPNPQDEVCRDSTD